VLVALALVVTLAAADVALLVHRAPTVAVTTPGSGDGTAYLLLGSDSRGRLPETDRERYADRHQASSERADLVMVLRTRRSGGAQLLSIPRDLYVGAGSGRPHRLGLALVDGPQAMVDSLCRDLGVGVDHVAILDFRGLIDLVDATGGVSVTTREPLRDNKSGLRLPRAGTQVLDGAQALAWVRSRQPEALRDGRWVPVTDADRTRTAHAVEVIGQAADGLADPLAAQRAAWSVAPRVRRDADLGVVEMASLARHLREALAANRVGTVPVRQTTTWVPVAFPTSGTEAALEPFRTESCRGG
jgi:LCP family protein required for cell wall assembly